MIKDEKSYERRILERPAIMFTVLSLLIVLSLTAAAATTVSIGDVTVLSPGESATIPIMITDVTDVGVAAIEFSYNPSVVHVTAVTDSQFDVCDPTIDNVTGEFEIGGVQFMSPGLNGNVRLANVTLKVVGTAGQSSPLNITINELKTVGPPPQIIPADVDNGTFTIRENTPPIVKNPSAVPMIIPEDTDNNPLWGELANLTVEATDESGIANVTVTVNLSLVGKKAKVMNLIGNYTNGILWGIFNYSTNASIGTAGWNGTAYEPHQLEINATDICGNSNTSVSIELTVMRNGDVNVDGDVTYSDAMYLYKWKAGKPGFDTIYETVADVDGDNSATYSDAMYLYKWKAGKPGFDVLH